MSNLSLLYYVAALLQVPCPEPHTSPSGQVHYAIGKEPVEWGGGVHMTTCRCQPSGCSQPQGTWLPRLIIFHTGSGWGLWCYWVWNTSGPLSRLTCPWTHLSHHKHRLPHCNSHQTHRWKTSLTALFICMSLIPGKAEKPLLSFLLSD